MICAFPDQHPLMVADSKSQRIMCFELSDDSLGKSAQSLAFILPNTEPNDSKSATQSNICQKHLQANVLVTDAKGNECVEMNQITKILEKKSEK